MVSLDGDAIHHDRNRRFADGRGSHAEVVRNLLAFRERYPSYSNIRLISVLDWRAELPTLDEFFSRSEGALPPLGRVSFVSRNDTNFFDGCAADDRRRMEDALREQAGIYMKERERGTTLSGGQLQRIAIARTLLRSPDIVIYDEPTSQLDRETEQKVLEATYRVTAGRTTIVISHRPEPLLRAGRRIVLDQGVVRES